MDIIKELRKLREHHNGIADNYTVQLRKDHGDFPSRDKQREHEGFSTVITKAIEAISGKSE